jgi:hypothetical protein
MAAALHFHTSKYTFFNFIINQFVAGMSVVGSIKDGKGLN